MRRPGRDQDSVKLPRRLGVPVQTFCHSGEKAGICIETEVNLGEGKGRP